MNILSSKRLYLIVLLILICGGFLFWWSQRSPSQKDETQGNNTSQQPAATKETATKPEEQKTTYAYEVIGVSQEMIASGQVPPCCKTYYVPPAQALIIKATKPNGSTQQFWFNVAGSGGGRTTYEFVPQFGGNEKIYGKPAPKNLGEARRLWEAMKLVNPDGSETLLAVKEVQTAIDYINNSFSSIPHANQF